MPPEQMRSLNAFFDLERLVAAARKASLTVLACVLLGPEAPPVISTFLGHRSPATTKRSDGVLGVAETRCWRRWRNGAS
ncbi:MAG: hypothetical protein NVS2B9_00020 [Myxococcales bacterium]